MKNYTNTNLACSILKEFGLSHNHSSIDEIDQLFNNSEVDNIVVILCDGMGTNILKKHLNESDFLLKNKMMDIQSVNPSTTTASTTTMRTGLNPCEHGWLGWDLYVKPIDKIVTLFLNTIKDTDIIAEDYNVGKKYFPYETITSKINNNTNYKSYEVSPFAGERYNSFNDMIDNIKSITNKPGKKYIYAYYVNPDETMHKTGTDSVETKNSIDEINLKLEKLYNELDNTIMIITADHGHKNSEPIILSNYPSIYKMLKRPTSIECRACSFDVKDEYLNDFKDEFNKLFSDYFILKTHDEIVNEKYFGEGNSCEYFEDAVGDYIALANSDKYILYDDNCLVMPSMHAGVTDDETVIPVIVAVKEKN